MFQIQQLLEISFVPRAMIVDQILYELYILNLKSFVILIIFSSKHLHVVELCKI